jgi:hypothetical protein
LNNFINKDWMEAGNCIVDDPEDTRFIRKPNPDEEKQWAHACRTCPVFFDCLEWADSLDEDNRLTDVFVAGEWRI